MWEGEEEKRGVKRKRLEREERMEEEEAEIKEKGREARETLWPRADQLLLVWRLTLSLILLQKGQRTEPQVPQPGATDRPSGSYPD